MSYNSLIFEVENGVGLIRLNRPDDGNTLSMEMVRELLDVASRCDEDPEVRSVVLDGKRQDVLRRRRPEGICRPG